MTPEQIAGLQAAAGIINAIAAGPIWLIIVCLVIGPWVLTVFLAIGQQKRAHKADRRFESVVKMYEDNVLVVKEYEKLASGMKDILVMSVGEWQGARSDIKNNHYCPVERAKKALGAVPP